MPDTVLSDTLFSDTEFSDTLFSETEFSDTVFSDTEFSDTDEKSGLFCIPVSSGTPLITELIVPFNASIL
ncbi:MAG: pentapeptide repeat-containing protein [Lachnospiraceae bacterium]